MPALLLTVLAATSTMADEHIKQSPKAVLELFTSQGCSSCPKADALLENLGKRSDIIALAYHVDYWDYIGWPDTFGAAANSDRQRAYAQAWGSSRIFTPQLIVNGVTGVVASHADEVQSAVDGAALRLPVTLTTGNGMLEVSIAGQAGLSESVVWLVTYLDAANVAIERGENEGKKVAYTQIVTDRQVLGMWDPVTGAHFKLPLSEVMTGKANGAVVLVQQEKQGLPGPVLGASSLQL